MYQEVRCCVWSVLSFEARAQISKKLLANETDEGGYPVSESMLDPGVEQSC